MTRCPARGDGIESGFPGAVNPRLRACPPTRSDFRRVELKCDKRQREIARELPPRATMFETAATGGWLRRRIRTAAP